MSDNEVNVKVTASTGELASGMGKAPNVVQQAADRMRASFSKLRDDTKASMGDMHSDVVNKVAGMAGSFGGLVNVLATTKAGFLLLAGVVAAVGFKKATDDVANTTESAMDLGRALGVTTNEARILQVAMKDLGVAPGELEAAGKGLSRQLRENEADMNKLGLTTRDAQGNFKPMTDLIADGIAVLNTYKEGADRAMVSQVLFGRGIDASSRLMLFNKDVVEENRQSMEKLGMATGENAVEAFKKYDAASDLASRSMDAMKEAIGKSVMPVMTDLIRLFNEVMPAAIVMVRGALAGLTSAFLYVKNGVIVLWETINAFVISVAEPIRAVTEAMGRAMVGDFSGAAAVMRGIAPTIAGAWENAMQRMTESSEETARTVASLFFADTAPGKTGGVTGTGNAPPGKGAKPAAAAADPSMMAYYQNALEQAKLYAAQLDPLREYTKAQEKEFWDTLLENQDLTAKDRLSIERRAAALEIDILRDTAKAGKAIDLERLKGREDAANAAVQLAATDAQAQYEAGAIGYTQLLALEAQFEQARNAIALNAAEARRAAIDPTRDPVAYEQVSQQIEAIERQHLQRMAEIKNRETQALAAPAMAVAESMRSGFENVLAGIGTRIKTLGDLFRGLGLAIWQSLSQAAAKMAADWIMRNIMMQAISKVTSLGRISEESAKAGAGGVASMAAAPFPLNLGAPAFGASMAAAAMSFAPLASASQGYDIPAGINPMTQLHQREMVLPQPQADVIRDLADGGGGAAQQPIVFHLHALDGASVKRVLMDNPAALAAAVRRAVKDGQLR